MKKLIPLIFALLLALSACGKTPDGVWKDALYTENASFGTGSKTLTVDVIAGDDSVTFTVKTDAETVAAALLEHGLIAGEDGPYGLYIKAVNGITADYDTDQRYWAFSQNGEYMMVGADMEPVTDGAHYEFTYAQ